MAASAGPEIERLISLLAKLPGMGPRSARRAALALLKRREQLLVPLAASLAETAAKVVNCSVCGAPDTRDPCSVCSDQTRDNALICVVEEAGACGPWSARAPFAASITCWAACSPRWTASAPNSCASPN